MDISKTKTFQQKFFFIFLAVSFIGLFAGATEAQPLISDPTIEPFNFVNFDSLFIHGNVNVSATVTGELLSITNVSFVITDFDLNETSCSGIPGEIGLWSCEINTSVLSDSSGSTYDMTVTATDQNGDSATEFYSDLNGSFGIDNTAPGTTDDYADKNDVWQNSTQNITLIPSDGGLGSGVASTKFCIDATNECEPGTGYTEPATVNDEGIRYFRYFSTDFENNNQPIISLIVKIDTVSPVHNYTIVSPSSVSSNSNITVTAKFDDAVSGVYSVSKQIKNSTGSNVGDLVNLTKSGSVWTIKENTGNLSEGTYMIVLVAVDNASNIISLNVANFTAVSPSEAAEGSETNNSVSLNSSSSNSLQFTTTPSTLVDINISSNSNVTNGTISVAEYSAAQNTSSVGIPSLNKYLDIEASPDVTSSIGYVIIKVGYTDAEISAAGIDESTLRLYFYNTSSGVWEKQDTPNGGVNTEENFVWANSTHFSRWGLFGLPQPVVSAQPQRQTTGDVSPPTLTLTIDGISSITIPAGETRTFALTVNTNRVALGTTIIANGIQLDWVSISPGSTDIIRGTGQDYTVSITIPATETARTIPLTFAATSGVKTTTKNVDLIITVAAQIAPPSPETTQTSASQSVVPTGQFVVGPGSILVGIGSLVALFAGYYIFSRIKKK